MFVITSLFSICKDIDCTRNIGAKKYRGRAQCSVHSAQYWGGAKYQSYRGEKQLQGQRQKYSILKDPFYCSIIYRNTMLLTINMLHFCMLGQCALLSIHTVTLITVIADSLMYRLLVCGQKCLMCGFVVTLISDSFMYRLLVCSQTMLLCCFVVTLMTFIPDSFIYRLLVT